MSLKAYQNAQLAVEEPRSVEYRLFGQVTGALIAAQRENQRGKELVDAIDWNRRLWSALASDCLDQTNALPGELRARIVSLSIWVAKYSGQVTRDAAPLEPLIDVNRTIMQGLHGTA